MSVVERRRPWIWLIVVLAAVALAVFLFLAWRVFAHVRKSFVPYLPPNAVEASDWAAKVPGAGDIRLLGVIDPTVPKARWWTPDGLPTARGFPSDVAEVNVARLKDLMRGNPCRTFRVEFVDGLPKQYELKGILGMDEPSSSSWAYDQGPAKGRRERYACASFMLKHIGRTDDLYVGVAAEKPTIAAVKAWPNGKVRTKSKSSQVTVELFEPVKPQHNATLVVGTSSDLNDGRISLVPKDAQGKVLSCTSAGSYEGRLWVRAGSFKGGENTRTFFFMLPAKDYQHLASVEVCWAPYRWVVFRHVALQPSK